MHEAHEYPTVEADHAHPVNGDAVPYVQVGSYSVHYAKTPFKHFDSTKLTLVHDNGTYTILEFYGSDKKLIKAESGFATPDGRAQPPHGQGGPKPTAHTSVIYDMGSVATGMLEINRSENGDWKDRSYASKNGYTDYAKNIDDITMDVDAFAAKYPTQAFGNPQAINELLADFQNTLSAMPKNTDNNDPLWQEIKACVAPKV